MARKELTPEEITEVLARLHAEYGRAECALEHRNAYELLAATILSAQCTDERVNKVTPALFSEYPTPFALAAARQEDVEALIRSTGFFRNKAKSLIGMAKGLVDKHAGEVPRTMEELVALPGVARKTANVVLGTAYGIAAGIVVDTHVERIAKLLGLTHAEGPVKIERDLMQKLPRAEWIAFSHRLIHHGRRVCIARRPKCEGCVLSALCVSAFAPQHASRKRTPTRQGAPSKRRKAATDR